MGVRPPIETLEPEPEICIDKKEPVDENFAQKRLEVQYKIQMEKIIEDMRGRSKEYLKEEKSRLAKAAKSRKTALQKLQKETGS
jgi:hypothetical protein